MAQDKAVLEKANAEKVNVEKTNTEKDNRLKALDLALAQIEKQFGKGSIMRLDGKVMVDIPVIPTGSLALDAALGVLPFHCERRPGFLRLRLGDHAAGNGTPGDLPRFGRHPAAGERHLVSAMGAFPPDVRRGPHQIARRRVLARPDLHVLPL